MSQTIFPAKLWAVASLVMLASALLPSTNRIATAQQRPIAADSGSATIVFASLNEPLQKQGDSLESLPDRPGISRLHLPNITQSEGRLPENAFKQVVPAEHEGVVSTDRGAQWGMVKFNWQPSELFHRPFYFDDVMLERHGHTAHWPLQPVISSARFVTSAAILPYSMTLDPPHRSMSTLGHYRAGSYAPPLLQVPPLRADAGTVQAGVVTGLIFLIP